MFPYPPLPVLFPSDVILALAAVMVLGSALTLCVRKSDRIRGSGLLRILVVCNAFLIFREWHWFPDSPQRWYENSLHQVIWWSSVTSWPLLLWQSIRTVGERPRSQGGLVGTWCFTVPPLLLWMMGSVSPRAVAYQSGCQNSLRQIAIAQYNDVEARRGPFLANRGGLNGEPARSWRVDLLPYMDDRTSLRRQYVDSEAWDSDKNRWVALAASMPYSCRANRAVADESGRRYSAYAACVGPDAFFPTTNGARSLDGVPDGLAQTAMIVEACGQDIVWTEPRDLDVTSVSLGINLPGAKPGESDGLLSAWHPFGANVLMGDGHVRAFGPETSPEVLRAILTVDGNEKTPFE